MKKTAEFIFGGFVTSAVTMEKTAGNKLIFESQVTITKIFSIFTGHD
jgi:hypothetical protein